MYTRRKNENVNASCVKLGVCFHVLWFKHFLSDMNACFRCFYSRMNHNGAIVTVLRNVVKRELHFQEV
jgi:hypothetical protein